MVPAGISNHAAGPLFRRKRRNLVVGPTQLEGADRLQVFGLEIKFAMVKHCRILT
jgi:hypothetical protein